MTIIHEFKVCGSRIWVTVRESNCPVFLSSRFVDLSPEDQLLLAEVV